MTNSNVIILTKKHACQRNALQVLRHAHGLNYLYTDPLGFMGGVSVLWDTSKVFLYGFHTDANHVSFLEKVMTMHRLLLALLNECPLLIPSWYHMWRGPSLRLHLCNPAIVTMLRTLGTHPPLIRNSQPRFSTTSVRISHMSNIVYYHNVPLGCTVSASCKPPQVACV